VRFVRPGAIAVVALVAAVLGGAAALAIGKGAGWTGGSPKTVVVQAQTPPPATPAAVQAPAKPLLGNGFQPAKVYAGRSDGVVTIYAFFGSQSDLQGQTAQGSGFVVSPKGYVLTNSHVITDAGDSSGGSVKAADHLYVEFQDHDRVPATVVGWDVFDDVGLIRVDPAQHALEPVPLGDSSKVVVGEPVAAIGSPFGNENSLSVGVVSATKRSIGSLTSSYNLVDAIQTDAPINHGNSGGPLFDSRARAIGINAQIRSDSGNAEGVGFAVPINSARRSMEQLIAKGRVSYAYVGISTEDLTPSIAKHFGYPVSYGAIVDCTESGSPGQDAGLRGGSNDVQFNGSAFRRGGDVIVAIDGTPVRNAEDVVRVVTERLAPGGVATLTIYRGDVRKTVPVRLIDRPKTPSSCR
jgi:S1-C subfamily serine protease